MGDWYLGEIRLFPYTSQKAPDGWLLCNGQTLTIAQNQALYSLLGTHFGGNGSTTFMLPDLRGRAIAGQRYSDPLFDPVGLKGGSDTVQLNLAQIPAHNHTLSGTSTTATTPAPTSGYFAEPVPPPATTIPGEVYAPPPATGAQMTSLYSGAVTIGGGGIPHENRQPFLVMTYCIANSGIYPPRN